MVPVSTPSRCCFGRRLSDKSSSRSPAPFSPRPIRLETCSKALRTPLWTSPISTRTSGSIRLTASTTTSGEPVREGSLLDVSLPRDVIAGAWRCGCPQARARACKRPLILGAQLLQPSGPHGADFVHRRGPAPGIIRTGGCARHRPAVASGIAATKSRASRRLRRRSRDGHDDFPSRPVDAKGAILITTAIPSSATNPRHEQGAQAIAAEAYVYLYPLVMMDTTRRQMTNAEPGGKPGFGPMNAFSHMRAFPPVEFKAVPWGNFDTLYSLAWLDVTDEPMVISVPDTGGRYYLLPIQDMWTDVFAVPGKRASGTDAGHFAVVGAGWHGELAAGVRRIDAPTPYVWIMGRTQTNGPGDYAAVNAVQDGYAITPLSQFGGESQPAAVVVDPTAPGPATPAGAASPPPPLSRWGGEPRPPAVVVAPTVDMPPPPAERVNGRAAADFSERPAELLKLPPPHITDWSVLTRMQQL